MPDHGEIDREAPDGSGLPSDLYGSDHLRLEALFRIKAKPAKAAMDESVYKK